MSTHHALQRGAVACSTPSRSDAGPRRPNSSCDQLERMSSRLDELIRDARLGARTHRELERQVDEAEAIAAGIRAAFRERTPANPVNPPAWEDGKGRAAW